LTTTHGTITCRERHCKWTEQGCQHSASKDSSYAATACYSVAIGQMPAQ
jgi:hypothetical protein